jgi:hypothetical protein
MTERDLSEEEDQIMMKLDVKVTGMSLGLLAAVTLATTSIAVGQPSPMESTSRPPDQSPRVTVTVQQLIDRDHRLEILAGTEVICADPHFERVWFPTSAGAPKIERTGPGFRAIFAKSGTYRGAFTIAGGHRSNDVYPLIVTVTEGGSEQKK